MKTPTVFSTATGKLAVKCITTITIIGFAIQLHARPVQLPLSSNADEYDLLDMSYTFNNDTNCLTHQPTQIYWPTFEVQGRRFRLEIIQRGLIVYNNFTVYNEANAFAAPEHGGTHVDAPSHFVAGGKRVGDIPLSQMMGPAVRIDITRQVEQAKKQGTDYLMTPYDLVAWEEQNGRIENGTMAFVYTGNGKYWPDRRAYLGFDGVNASDLHFPALSEAAAKVLKSRGVKAVGIDAASPDLQNSPLVHLVLLGADILIFENVANLQDLPTKGAFVYALPMKIGDGGGAPVRLLAHVPKNSTNGTAFGGD